jgi:hypothetical protein
MVPQNPKEDDGNLPLDWHRHGVGRQVPHCVNHVQRPLQLGGLGVLDIKLFGTALGARWLWLEHMEPSRPWASMKIIEDKHTMAIFNTSVRFLLGNGEIFLF